VLIGSRYFAGHQPPGYPPLFAVLFDMVADKDQQFYYEGNSQAGRRRWWTGVAGRRRPGLRPLFMPGVKHTLIDDHVALQKAGIHAIDVVDFDYPYWHTTEDTIDKVSAASLQVVGDVAVALVNRVRFLVAISWHPRRIWFLTRHRSVYASAMDDRKAALLLALSRSRRGCATGARPATAAAPATCGSCPWIRRRGGLRAPPERRRLARPLPR